MSEKVDRQIQEEIKGIKEAGLFKRERTITSPQAAKIHTLEGGDVLNFCANNYLGLSSHPRVIAAAKEAIDTHGYGMSSVRFICGTQDIHKELEAKIAAWVGCEDAILYAAAFDANGGLFEPLLNEEDAIISDQLNHASIIDGIRLCKAARYRYANNDMNDLEEKLKETQGARRRLIATDGVFSMDGIIAQIDKICDLAEKYDAMVMLDDCHATGFVGKTGRGSAEHNDAFGRVDIITGTFGKALGGASGGFTAASKPVVDLLRQRSRPYLFSNTLAPSIVGASGGFTAASKPVVDLLRQRSRPYLFSNTLAPSIVGASIAVLDMLEETTELRDKLERSTAYFREGMTNAGFDIVKGIHPIVPVMLYDAPLSQVFADDLLKEGIYVIGFYYPVVPQNQARIRVQISAGHEMEHLDKAIEAFTKIGKKHKVVS